MAQQMVCLLWDRPIKDRWNVEHFGELCGRTCDAMVSNREQAGISSSVECRETAFGDIRVQHTYVQHMLGDHDKPLCRAQWRRSPDVSKFTENQTLLAWRARHLSREHIVSCSRSRSRQFSESFDIDNMGAGVECGRRREFPSFWN